MNEEFEEHESLDESDEEEESRFRSRFIRIMVLLLSLAILSLATLIIYFNWGDKGEDKDTKEEKQPIIDTSLIPSYELAEVVLEGAWNDIVGMEFNEFFEEYEVAEGDYFRIPSTNTIMDNHGVSGIVEHLGLIQLAYQKNPFLIDEETPPTLAKFDDAEIYKGDTIQLPDGTEVNMRTISQVYSEMRVNVNPANPLKFEYTGYVDGGYFEEEVDLTSMYIEYAN